MSPNCLPTEAMRTGQERRARQVHEEQVRLLYTNATAGTVVTVIAVSVLGYLQWAVVPRVTVAGWVAYMMTVSAARFVLAQLYWRRAGRRMDTDRWGAAFACGTALSGAGWGGASFLLYPEA